MKVIAMAADKLESTAQLPERLTLQEAVRVLDQLKQSLAKQSGDRVVVDARGLRVFDTSAVAVLLALRRNLQGQGKQLIVDHWPQRLSDLVGLYGVSDLLLT
jgi:phospholipid transport system transporter-binding protein